MEKQFYIITLLFGEQMVLKKAIAEDEIKVIELIKETYPHTQIMGVVSLDDLEKTMDLTENSSNYFINELIVDSNIKTKSFIEENTTLEKVMIKYENRNCHILNANDMRKRLAIIYAWLEETMETENPIESMED